MSAQAREKAYLFYDEVVAHFSSANVLVAVKKHLLRFREFEDNPQITASMPEHTIPALVSQAFPAQPTEAYSCAAFFRPESPSTPKYAFTHAPDPNPKNHVRRASSGPTR